MPFHAGDIEATLDLDRSPFQQGLAQARAEAKRYEAEHIKAKIDVDKSQLDSALARGSGGRGIEIPATIDQKRLVEQLERIGTNTETTARRSGNRLARALLNPVVIQLGLLPGIAAASAALAGASIGALPVAFAAVAAIALKKNEDITNAYKDLWQEVKATTQDAAQGLRVYGVEIARELWGGLKTIEPNLRGIFSALGPQVLDLSQGLVGLATNAIPGVERAVRLAGPVMRGWESLFKSTGTGIGQFFDQVSKRSLDVGHGVELLGTLIQSLLNNLGRMAASFSQAWSQIGPNFVRDLDKLLGLINNAVSGGIPAFSGSLKVTLGVLEAILNVMGPIADIFGGSAGWLLGAVASWKLLAGAVGLATKAFSAAAPSVWLKRMEGFTARVDQAAMATGGFITKTTGSETAGNRFSSVMGKIGSSAARAASFIPLIGVGVAGATAAVDHFFPSADNLSSALVRGGKDAEEAKTKIVGLKEGYSEANIFAAMFGTTTDEVAGAIRRQRESMTFVERAQLDLVKAQNDYQYAIDKFGAGSDQAVAAQHSLAAATKGVEDAQLRAAQATQTHTDKIVFQTNLLLGAVGARLNYQGALLSLEDAQKKSAEATRDHGAKSLEARQANLVYQQSLLGVVTSLGERTKAENADLSETEQNRLATFAMHQEIARLAVIAGKDAPPALQQLMGALSASELAALGVHKEVDKTGTAIYTLPPGKTLNFPTDAPIAKKQVEDLHSAVDNLPRRKDFDYVINVVTGKSESLPGLVTGLPGRAEGGPVRRNMAYWVGETGQPELFFPNVDGFVLNDRDSKRLASSQFGSDGATLAPGQLGGFGLDTGALVGLMVQAIVQALGQLRLRVDGQEWARLVNSVNTANERR